MLNKLRSLPLYILLILMWVGICWWLTESSATEEERAHQSLIDRSKAISTSVGVVVRTCNILQKPQHYALLKSSLNDLKQSEDILAISLLDTNRNTVIAVGDNVLLDSIDLKSQDTVTGEGFLATIHMLELGPSPSSKFQPERKGPPLKEGEVQGRKRRGRMYSREAEERRVTMPHLDEKRAREKLEERGFGKDFINAFMRIRESAPDKIRELFQQKGVHGFVTVMNTTHIEKALSHDKFMKMLFASISLLAFISFGLFWWLREHSSTLRENLVKTEQINTNLREKNIAAAGLAHETRNPLSIIRGVAQLIEKEEAVPAPLKKQTEVLMNEVDRITCRLNEFIKYSRIHEPEINNTSLGDLLEEVCQTLSFDVEEKNISLEISGPSLKVAIDKEMFRQVFFNLILNAIQAVEKNGHVWIITDVLSKAILSVSIEDDGPGVAEKDRENIFHPYISMSKRGTGLGLAVVQQIVHSHSCTIDCLPRNKGGAVFRISNIPHAQA